jgi:hypothetical protein
VASLAFLVGSATIVTAATTSIGSIFFISVLSGVATTPCSSYTGVDGRTTTTCVAVINSKGELTTKDADVRTALDRLTFGADGSLKVSAQGTSTISGAVGVNNFPADQLIHGTVTVGNLPAAAVGGVTVIELTPDRSVPAHATRMWEVNVSSCRSFSVAMATDRFYRPSIELFVDSPLMYWQPWSHGAQFPVDLKKKDELNVQWAFPVQPGSTEPFYAPKVYIKGVNDGGETAGLFASVFCQH